MTDDPKPLMATIAGRLANSRRVLIASHLRPDGDAVGSLLGLHLLLQANGIASLPYMRENPGDTYRRLLPTEALSNRLTADDSFDTLCLLDCGNPERIDLPENVPLRADAIVIDHHPDNRRYGKDNLVIPEATSTSEILLNLAEAAGWRIHADAASALCLGLIADCGTFRFDNVSPTTFDCAAKLLRLGADYRKIVETLHFSEPAGAQKLRNDVFRRARFACRGQIAWSHVAADDFKRHGIHPQDAENLIDVIRCIDTVAIACLLQPETDGVRFSLRSRSPGGSAAAIARALGGGGHEVAAGARVEGISLEQAARRFRELAERQIA